MARRRLIASRTSSFRIWLTCQPSRTKHINNAPSSNLPLSSLVPLPCPSCRMSGDPGVPSLPHSLLTYLLLLQVFGTRCSAVACRCVPVEGPLRVVEFEATPSCQVRRSPWPSICPRAECPVECCARGFPFQGRRCMCRALSSIGRIRARLPLRRLPLAG